MTDLCVVVRFQMDNWNKLKNICSKEIGTKMKNKENVGQDDSLPEELTEKLDSLTAEMIRVCRDDQGWLGVSLLPPSLCLCVCVVVCACM